MTKSSNGTIGSVNGLYQVDPMNLYADLDCSGIKKLKSEIKTIYNKYANEEYILTGLIESMDNIVNALRPIFRKETIRTGKLKIQYKELKKQLIKTQQKSKKYKMQLRAKTDKLEACIVKSRLEAFK